MTPEPEPKKIEEKPKKLSKKEEQELYENTKKLLQERIKQINMGIHDPGTSLGIDPYIIFPIDED